ncbi:MAG: FeoB-associated Cys-rich membrane protein [Clostridiales Family XIII bacterium]|nr:FeoB-associated Cys-rich membrane protein [Clostridiales Family XIII bacterium]
MFEVFAFLQNNTGTILVALAVFGWAAWVVVRGIMGARRKESCANCPSSCSGGCPHTKH